MHYTLIPNVNIVVTNFKINAIDKSIMAVYTPGPATLAFSVV